jgi:hypothetical protein
MTVNTLETVVDGCIEVPVMSAYGACLAARRDGRLSDADELLLALATMPIKGAALRFAHLAESGMKKHLIPFARDALDLHVVSAYMPTGRFFSDVSFIDVGFFWIGHHGAVYLDQLPIAEERVSASPELLESARVVELLATLMALDDRSVRVCVPTDASGALFEISSSVLGECIDEAPALDVEVFLVRADSSSPAGAIRRRLAAVKTQQAQQGNHEIRLRPEHTMEVHAAAMAGHWLLVESSQFRLLAPLPDFFHEGASTAAWLQPTRAFGRALGARAAAVVQLNAGLAKRLMQRHRWFVPVDAVRWFSAVHPTSLNTDQEYLSNP